MKPTQIVLSQDALQTMQRLASHDDKRSASILHGILRALSLLEQRPFAGAIVPRKLRPRRLRHVGTLLRLELPSFWRLLYTVGDDERGAFVLITIIDILDHPAYDRLFGYKNH